MTKTFFEPQPSYFHYTIQAKFYSVYILNSVAQMLTVFRGNVKWEVKMQSPKKEV